VRYEEFIEQVQTRGYMEDRAEAQTATRATLKTLAESLDERESYDLAAQLPQELAEHLRHEGAGAAESLSLDEFVDRLNERDGEGDRQRAVYHARVVIEVLGYVLGQGEIERIRSQLPGEFDPLFDAGSQGGMAT
jgi:uncharacterized protein (DUF2267 family)